MIPMTVISGYLGSGKTTFLNRVLSEPTSKSYAVLVNDFGEIALDEQLIDFEDGELIALRNGCVCCQIGDDLLDAIDTILNRTTKPDHILLEASGVSDPGKLIQIAQAEPDLIPGGVLTLVDVLNYETHSKDPLVSDTLDLQISAANQILVTKSDIAPPTKTRATLSILHSRYPTFSIALSAKDISANLEFTDIAVRSIQPQAHHPNYKTWSYQGNAEIGIEVLERLCSSQSGRLLRLKGFINTHQDGRQLVHFAGTHWSSQPVGDDGPTELVAIGCIDGFDSKPLEALTQ